MVSGFIARGGLPKTPIALLHGGSVGFVGSKGSRTFVATNVPPFAESKCTQIK